MFTEDIRRLVWALLVLLVNNLQDGDCCILECDAAQSDRSLPTFRMYLLPPSLGLKNALSKKGAGSK